MRLTKAIQASRANGARSRGPVTEEAKRRSSQNAIRHGLLSKNVVLENECGEVFSALHAAHVDKLAPAGDVEHSTVPVASGGCAASALSKRNSSTRQSKNSPERMKWRGLPLLTRIRGSRLWPPATQLPERYEARLHRMYERCLHNLLILRQFDTVQEDQDIADTTQCETNLFPDNPLLA